MKWKYKLKLKDENVFDEIETEFGRRISPTLKKLIIEANAATPDKCRIMIDGEERIVGAVLSFNKNEKDADTVFTALEIIDDTKLLPFAIDPFGNYFCLKRFDVVVFWNHETGQVKTTKKDLTTFISSLY